MDAVIFDMDGVLIDSEVAHQEAEITTFKDFGVTITIDQLKPFAGSNSDAFKAGMIEKHQCNIDWDAYYEQKDELLFELMHNVEAIPGIIELLKDCKNQGMKLGVATSSKRELMEFVINKFAMKELFDELVCTNDITRSKPDPEIFQVCASRLGVDSENCIVVEDSINGIKGANTAGMFSLGLTTTFNKDELHEADQVIDRFDEINAQYLKQVSKATVSQ
jgi:beta-phosphoglucomutase